MTPPSLRPLTVRLRRRLAGKHLTACASEVVELAPAYHSNRPAAIALPGEFDRAIGFPETREMERLRVMGGTREEGATVMYLLENATVGGGIVSVGSVGDIYRSDSPKILLNARASRRNEAMLVTNKSAETYFGDWLVEGFSLALLAQRQGKTPVRFARRPWLHEAGYIDLLGLPSEQVEHAHFRRLWLVDDRGINEDRAARFRELRRRIREKAATESGPERVFLARGNLGQMRALTNEAELIAMLQRSGFAIVHPEREVPATVARTLGSARTIVTVEGSAQVHALLAAPEQAALIAIQPPQRFTAPGKDLADMAHMHYGYVVGDPDGAGFTLDLQRLRDLLDLVERTSS